jgi:poly(beta-D-mannuronate) lyase
MKTGFRLNLWLGVIATFACVSGQSSIWARDVSLPFAVPMRKASDSPDFRCPPAPPAVVDLADVVFYTDRANSVVDPNLWKKRQALSQPVRSFADTVVRMADLYVASGGARSDLATCVAESIVFWARKGAFLGKVSTWARYDTLWFGQISLGIAYLKVSASPAISRRTADEITTWLARVAEAAVAEQDAPAYRGRQTNIRAWTAAAQAVAAVARDDRSMLDKAVATARGVLNTVTPEGALPAELARGRRAFIYHIWALEPLALVGLIARRNGIPLDSENNDALYRVARLVITSSESPEIMIRLAGIEQDGIDRFPQPWQLGFAAIMLGLRDDPALRKIVSRHHPIVSPFSGGNWTAILNLQ